MKRRVDISVLISVYKGDDPFFLKESLDSLFLQTVDVAEIVLLKDGALTTELNAVIETFADKFKNLRVVSFPNNRGLGKTLNEGLYLCNYDIIARMDADDISKPERLEKEYDWLLSHRDFDLVGTWVDEFIDDKEQVVAVRAVPENATEIIEFARSRCPVNHPTVMYRKKAVLDVGGYFTEMFPEDYFLWIKMLMNGSKFYNIQESLLWFRYSRDTIKRRGGWKYAYDEVRTQIKIWKMGFISFPLFCKNIIVRTITRIMPWPIRSCVYNLIRKH